MEHMTVIVKMLEEADNLNRKKLITTTKEIPMLHHTSTHLHTHIVKQGKQI